MRANRWPNEGRAAKSGLCQNPTFLVIQPYCNTREIGRETSSKTGRPTKFGWPHEGGKNPGTWPHEGGVWHSQTRDLYETPSSVRT
jgi:hypothetical protein